MVSHDVLVSPFLRPDRTPLDAAKFRDPLWTVAGEVRASVALRALRTLWFNTGTLCNLACANCYIDSSPRNDSLAYLSAAEVASFLDEVEAGGWPVEEVGFTGGEPFLNRALPAMLDDSLRRGHRALVLTNAMQPMRHHEAALLALRDRHGDRLGLRVSLDHHTQPVHEAERGPGSWDKALAGLGWLASRGFRVSVAGRRLAAEPEAGARAGYARLFEGLGLAADASDPAVLVLFPEMDRGADVPEITTACWGLLGKRPEQMMCASSRMVVKRRGEGRPVVAACTLLPELVLGHTLREAAGTVALNHPHCARFCVLGGASCSA